MKKGILLEELYRIQELMGKKLINEQWVALAKVIQNAAGSLPDLLAKHADDFARLAAATTDEEAIKILAKLANAEKQFADQILPEVWKSLSDEVAQEIAAITKAAKDQLAGGTPRATVDNLVEQRLKTIKTEFDGIKDLVRKNIKDDLDNFKPTPNPPKPEPPAPKPDDTGLVQSLKNAISEWDKIVPGGLSVKDKMLLGKGFAWRSLRARMNYVVNNLLNNLKGQREATLNKIASLVKKQRELAQEGMEDDLIYKTIDAELEALRKNEKSSKELLYNALREELDKILGPGRGSEFVNKLKANDAMSPEAQTYWRYLMDETYIGKMFTAPRDKSGKIIWSEWLRNFGERIIMFLTTGNPRKVSDIFNEFIKVYGVTGGTLYWAAWMKMVSLTVWPLFLAFVDIMYAGFKTEGGEESFGDWWELYKAQVWERFKDGFLNDYQQKFDEDAKKFVDERTWSFFRTINPFTWMWDDVSSGLDWHVGGGTNKFLRDLQKKGEVAANQAGINLDPNKVTQLVSYQNKLESFQDFGVVAGYTVEEIEKFTYDESKKQGTTSDGRVFELRENPETKTKNFVQISGPGI